MSIMKKSRSFVPLDATAYLAVWEGCTVKFIIRPLKRNVDELVAKAVSVMITICKKRGWFLVAEPEVVKLKIETVIIATTAHPQGAKLIFDYFVDVFRRILGDEDNLFEDNKLFLGDTG